MRLSVIIPTRARPAYLDVALGSLSAAVADAGGELVVVDDGPDPDTAAVARRHGARYVSHDAHRGLNVARNTGLENARGDLLAFVDDDVRAPAGWVAAVLDGASRHPEADAFGGPLHAVLEGSRLRLCGREGPPVSFLDLGPVDRTVDVVWGANMALRPRALERAGWFDPRLSGPGDEEEWLARLRAAGGRIVYLAATGLEHRRAGADARLPALGRAAFARGRAARRFDARRGVAPPARTELRNVAGCAWHTVRRACGNGIVLGAASLGRLCEALHPAPDERAPGWASGRSGELAGTRRAVAVITDLLLDAELTLSTRRTALRRAARTEPPGTRDVLVLGIDRGGGGSLMPAAIAELRRSRHRVQVIVGPPGNWGKFENLNALLAEHAPINSDWLLLIDDDVLLPRGFLDGLLCVAERLDLALVAPAHRRHSHAAWPVTRRRLATVARQTALVEIGPVTALGARTFDALLPFPDTRMGWGLDAHWAALAAEHGWRAGIVDALAVAHRGAPIAAAYDRADAMAEAERMLAGRSWLGRPALETVHRRHRRLPAAP